MGRRRKRFKIWDSCSYFKTDLGRRTQSLPLCSELVRFFCPIHATGVQIKAREKNSRNAYNAYRPIPATKKASQDVCACCINLPEIYP